MEGGIAAWITRPRTIAALLVALVASMVASTEAEAGPFTRKRMRREWPERQIDAAFVLPRGWTEVSLGFDHKVADASWDTNGERDTWEDGTRWRYSRLTVGIDHGFSRHTRIYVRIPWVFATLDPGDGERISTRAIGDVTSGLVVQPWLGRAWDLAFRLEVKAPSGVEWPRGTVEGPDAISGFLTGTGITNLGFHIDQRIRVGPFMAFEGSYGYVVKLPAVVGYVIGADGFGNGWLDPGDELLLHGAAIGQVTDDLALTMEAWISHRGSYRIGTSGSSPFRNALEHIPDSSGTFVDSGLRISWEPIDNIGLELAGRFAMAGRNTDLFGALGLEEFSPQPGWQVGGKVTARW